MNAQLYEPLFSKITSIPSSPFISFEQPSEMRDCLLGYHPQVGSNQIFHFFLRLIVHECFHRMNKCHKRCTRLNREIVEVERMGSDLSQMVVQSWRERS